MRTPAGVGIGVVLAVIALYWLRIGQGLIFGFQARLYLRNYVEIFGPLVAIGIVVGFLAWKERSLLVPALATAIAIVAAVIAGFAVFYGFLLAITPPFPPDEAFVYPDDTITTAMLLGLAAAVAIVISALAVFVLLRRSSGA